MNSIWSSAGQQLKGKLSEPGSEPLIAWCDPKLGGTLVDALSLFTDRPS